jgi:hypothetical protein
MQKEKALNEIKIEGYPQILSWRSHPCRVENYFTIEMLYTHKNGKKTQMTIYKSEKEWEAMKLQYRLLDTLTVDQRKMFEEFVNVFGSFKYNEGIESTLED